MANKNFVVHNGLTVGSLTIDAATGNIAISGSNVITGSGSLVGGNITISGDTISSSQTTITIDPSTAGAGGTVVIAGNLQVTGTTTTIDSTVITTNDLSITLANNAATAAAANGAGLSVNGANTFFRYESTPNSWVIDRSFIPNANSTLSLGATGSRWANIWGLSSSSQYADLAERYNAGEEIEPGTVVEFDGDNEVQVCGTAMSTKIAGVVSTAPGYLMNDSLDKDTTWVAIALQGRVPTKVVGPVAKGDMMVSAGNGHAMSCAAPVIGSVIGKALENFAEGEGVIEVVIGRI